MVGQCLLVCMNLFLVVYEFCYCNNKLHGEYFIVGECCMLNFLYYVISYSSFI